MGAEGRGQEGESIVSRTVMPGLGGLARVQGAIQRPMARLSVGADVATGREEPPTRSARTDP